MLFRSDVLSPDAIALFRKGELRILPPVASAIAEILNTHHISVVEKDVLIVGHGKLVGVPAAILMRHNGAHVTIIEKPTSALPQLTKEADIIVLGVGVPGLLRPSMVKKGVVILDAGTSETGGVLVGDADPECVTHASLFTPVPGGIGPVTVACLMQNIVMLSQHHD